MNTPQIIVVPRHEFAEAWERLSKATPNGWIGISIEDFNGQPHLYDNPQILNLDFDDASENETDMHPMTIEQAEKVIAFVKANPNKNVLIHCTARQCARVGTTIPCKSPEAEAAMPCPTGDC